MKIVVDFYIVKEDHLEVSYKTTMELLCVTRKAVKEKMLNKYKYFNHNLIKKEEYKFIEKEKLVKLVIHY